VLRTRHYSVIIRKRDGRFGRVETATNDDQGLRDEIQDIRRKLHRKQRK